MQTVEETRRARLHMLITQAGGASILAGKLQRAEAQISQYVTQKRNIGSDFARYIETTLELETGWMDTPPAYTELGGSNEVISRAVTVLQAMEPEQRYQALRLLDIFAESKEPLKTGS